MLCLPEQSKSQEAGEGSFRDLCWGPWGSFDLLLVQRTGQKHLVVVKTRLRSRVSLAKLLGLSVRGTNDELPRWGLRFGDLRIEINLLLLCKLR